MSPSARHTGLLFVVSAPSGAGKTSLVAELISRTDGLSVCVSHTTRPIRSSEMDGVNYHFTSVAHFEAMIADGEFLEHAKVFENYYGTARSSVETALAAGQDLILEIDWQGAVQVREQFPQARSIFILPPSRSALEQRLRGRGQDAEEVIQRRLSQAVEEMSHCHEFDYLVVNDDFQQAADELAAIILAARLSTSAQQEALSNEISELLNGSPDSS